MKRSSKKPDFDIRQYLLKDDGTFPNSDLPVLHYRTVIELPAIFPALYVKALFKKNGWGNNWRMGIYTYHHYHTTAHEALAVIKGKTTLLLGGDEGKLVTIEKGDVVIIPAGVAHKNTGGQDDVVCVGGYAGSRDFDMNYGRLGERPMADRNIAEVPLPLTDPVMGRKGVAEIWKRVNEKVSI